MTLLQISEKIRDHLIKQKARSVQGYTCAYRGEADGLMCAVGCLIPDSVYDDIIEQRGSSHNLVQSALSKSLKLELDGYSRDVVKYWQNYHDTWHCDGMLIFNYGDWIKKDNCDPQSKNSPQAFLDYLKGLKRFDMSGEITKRYLSQVSLFIHNHLLRQGKQAANEDGGCKYRYDGLQCAAGAMISDEHYDADFEGFNISNERVSFAIADSLGIDRTKSPRFGTPLYHVIRTWQRYHDHTDSTFSVDELRAKHCEIMLALDNTDQYPNLKD